MQDRSEWRGQCAVGEVARGSQVRRAAVPAQRGAAALEAFLARNLNTSRSSLRTTLAFLFFAIWLPFDLFNQYPPMRCNLWFNNYIIKLIIIIIIIIY